MKKILIATIGIFFLFACSNDSETTNQNHSNMRGGSLLADLYDDMVNSASYITYDTAHKNFIAKMNYDDNPAAIDSEDKLLSWISLNISKTGFADYTSAKTEWENVKYKFEVMATDNHAFFSEFHNSTNPAGDIIQLIGTPELPVSTSSCEDNCISEYSSSMAAIGTAYGNAFAAAYNASENGNPKASTMFSGAKITRDLEIEIADGVLAMCMYQCKHGG
jgi:hypothetical protein